MSKKTKKVLKFNNIETKGITYIYLRKYIFPILFLNFVSLATSFKISGDDDIFWHLKTGEFILRNKTVPSTDVFGLTTHQSE
jgi:hypothetical protein